MVAIALTEQQVINNAYYLLEKASELWASGSDEYLTARGLANIAINRWEMYDNTKWVDLFTTLTAASTGTKTLTSGTTTYVTPDDFRFPSSYVRTTDSGGGSTFWQVIKPAKLTMYANSSARVCWFTGNIKTGYTLNLNPMCPLSTGNTINYEYYKAATKFTTTTDTTEVPDPYFISYYIAAHMAEEGVDPDMNTMAEERLEQMRIVNMSQLYGVSDDIPTSGESQPGFGY
jgi:hypothetical protein